MADTSIDQSPVNIQSRYTAACLEYNARIAARHSLLNMYLTASIALIAILFTKYQTDSNKQPLMPKDMVNACVFAIPIISIIFGLFMGMHDYILGLLHNFMKELERYNNPSGEFGFHSDPHWSKPFRTVRLVPTVVLPSIALLICAIAYLQAESLTPIEEITFLFLAAVAILIPILFTIFREKFYGKQKHHVASALPAQTQKESLNPCEKQGV